MLSKRSENPNGKADSFEKEQVAISWSISKGGANGAIGVKVAVWKRRS